MIRTKKENTNRKDINRKEKIKGNELKKDTFNWVSTKKVVRKKKIYIYTPYVCLGSTSAHFLTKYTRSKDYKLKGKKDGNE